MVHVINVEPGALGWMVSADAFDNCMVFLSGAKAEAAAKQLARTFAACGQGAEVRVILADGVVVGRFACAPKVQLKMVS
ncbi:MAG: hypothetical protein ACM3W4_11160 [Ignavibacteriales bacterium]